MPRIARRVILDRFKGKVIGEEPQNAFVRTDGAEEYAYPRVHIYGETLEAKMRATGELDDMLRIATPDGHEPDDGHHPEAIGGWDYFRTIFEVGGKFYSGRFNIMNIARGRVFHDVTDVKREPALDIRPLHAEALGPFQGGQQGHSTSTAPGSQAESSGGDSPK